MKGETVRGVVGMLHACDGRSVGVSASAAPIRSADGKLAGAVLVLTDVTYRKRAEDELRLHPALRLAPHFGVVHPANVELRVVLSWFYTHRS